MNMEQDNLNKKPEEVGTVGMIFGFIILIVIAFFAIKVLAFIWGAISNSIGNEPENNTVSEVSSEEVQQDEVPPPSRCLSVPDVIAQRLNDGLNTDGTSITNLRAVKSNDFPSAYFISGELNGPGLEDDGHIATFITNKLDYTGATFSADAIATEFSDWPNITSTNLLGEGASLSTLVGSDGFDESRECVHN